MTLVDMIAAFTIATLAGTGVGGGGLFVIYLTLVGKMAQNPAQAVNLVFFISASITALFYHLRYRKLNPKVILLCTVFGIIGTFLGGTLRLSRDENTVRSAFGVMLVITGGYSLLKGSRKRGKRLPKIISCFFNIFVL